MVRGRTRFAAAALAAAVGAGAAAHGGGAQAAPATTAAYKTKIVKMDDNYYSPAKLKIHKGQRVQWVWPNDVGDTHDVKVRKAPKGAKKFTSPGYATGAKWPRPKGKVFKVKGTYSLYCTYHETEMTMTIKVVK